MDRAVEGGKGHGDVEVTALRGTLLAALLAAAALVPACGSAPVAAPTRPPFAGGPDEGPTPAPDDSPSGPADAATTSSRLADLFSVASKVDEVRSLYEQGRDEYAARQAEDLFPLIPPRGKECMELHFLAARCYQRLSDEPARARHDRAFRELLEEQGKSQEHQQGLASGAAARGLIDRALGAEGPGPAKGSASAAGEGDEFLNVRCWKRLQKVSGDQVLHENMDAGGEIYYGRDADAVRSQAAAGLSVPADEVVLSRDGRFRFYFVIVEPAP